MKLQDLVEFDGKLELYAQNSHFLGLLSSNDRDCNSILNLQTYGSRNYVNGIHYRYGIYGGPHGQHSPYNPYCLCPPMIVFQQQSLCLLSKNMNALSNGLIIIDPDLILGIYTNLSNKKISLFDNYSIEEIANLN